MKEKMIIRLSYHTQGEQDGKKEIMDYSCIGLGLRNIINDYFSCKSSRFGETMVMFLLWNSRETGEGSLDSHSFLQPPLWGER